MTPTPKLRFVERSVPMHPFYKTVDADGKFIDAIQTVRILQQWWEWETCEQHERQPWGTPFGEWRDVPTEKETA